MDFDAVTLIMTRGDMDLYTYKAPVHFYMKFASFIFQPRLHKEV